MQNMLCCCDDSFVLGSQIYYDIIFIFIQFTYTKLFQREIYYQPKPTPKSSTQHNSSTQLHIHDQKPSFTSFIKQNKCFHNLLEIQLTKYFVKELPYLLKSQYKIKCFQTKIVYFFIIIINSMSSAFVNIEIEAVPHKGQDRQIIELELETDTSIEEIIDYLRAENKIVLQNKDIAVMKGNEVMSSQVIISDMMNYNGKNIELKVKSKLLEVPKTYIPQSQIVVPKAAPSFFQSRNQVSSNLIPQGQKKPQFKDTHQNSSTKQTSISNQKYQIQNQPSYQDNSRYSQQNLRAASRNIQHNYLSNKSTNKVSSNSQRNEKGKNQDDIQFKVNYKQGGYSREFHYVSKKEDQKSQCLSVSKRNNAIEITIVDNNRRIKFEVEKI